jgi:integrase
MKDKTWDPPRYTFAEKLPFIPQEKEINDLIAGCGPKTATFILLLKETAMRSGEAQRLHWDDIDFESKTIRVTPEKGSNPRIFKISDKLVGMLYRLKTWNISRNPNKAFANDIKSIKRTYLNQRKRIATKLGNPRLNLIHFHTLRHWKASDLYHRTKDLLYVQQFLGHKSISNTLKYIQLSNALFDEDTDRYICKVARTVQDATELVELGFDYVTDIDGVKLFRKPA